MDIVERIEMDIINRYGYYIYDNETLDQIERYLSSNYPDVKFDVQCDDVGMCNVKMIFESDQHKLMWMLKFS